MIGFRVWKQLHRADVSEQTSDSNMNDFCHICHLYTKNYIICLIIMVVDIYLISYSIIIFCSL